MKSSPSVSEVNSTPTKISGLGTKHIYFDLPDGTGIEQAREFARALRSFEVRVRIA
jgi:hypothetical protein